MQVNLVGFGVLQWFFRFLANERAISTLDMMGLESGRGNFQTHPLEGFVGDSFWESKGLFLLSIFGIVELKVSSFKYRQEYRFFCVVTISWVVPLPINDHHQENIACLVCVFVGDFLRILPWNSPPFGRICFRCSNHLRQI